MKASRIVNAETNSKQNKTLKEESRVKTLLTTTLIILILFVAVPFSHASYQVTQLTTDTYDDLKPQINYTGEVVYEKHLAGDSEIYMHNGAGEYNVSRRSSFSDNPQINSGGNVLWESEERFLRFILVNFSNFAFDLAISPPDPNNREHYPFLTNYL